MLVVGPMVALKHVGRFLCGIFSVELKAEMGGVQRGRESLIVTAQQSKTPDPFEFSNPASFGDPTGLYLAAFDGTWDRKQNKDAKPGLGNNGNHTIIQQFVDRDHEQTDYHSGVGTGGGWLGAALGGGFGIGSFTMVDDAWDKMQKYYSDKTKWCEPVDIIGYSRGCYCALLLAQKVSEGIPEAGAPGGKVHPKIRFVGLVSPVAQMGLPPFNLHLGFPDQPPKDTQLFAQALEGVENPIFNESNIEPPDGVKGVKKTFDEGNIGLAHANIGSDPNALDWLITQAQSVDVPVK